MLVSEIPLHELKKAELKIGCNSDSNFDSERIFRSLSTSSEFMTMAINRSQDFVKSR